MSLRVGRLCDLKIPFGATNVITSRGMGREENSHLGMGHDTQVKRPNSFSKRNSLHKISAQTSGCEGNWGVCTPFFTTMRPANLALTLVRSLSDLGTHPAPEVNRRPLLSLETASGLPKAIAPVLLRPG